jgi:hypothetical protein
MCSAILHTDLNARDMYIKYVSLAIYGDIYSITASDVHVPAAWPRRQIHVDRSMKSAKCRMNGKWAPKDSMEFEVLRSTGTTYNYCVVLVPASTIVTVRCIYTSTSTSESVQLVLVLVLVLRSTGTGARTRLLVPVLVQYCTEPSVLLLVPVLDYL